MRPNRTNRRTFPKIPAVPSGLRSVLLNPDLQMQDLVDQMNNQEPIPTTPITKVSASSIAIRETRLAS